MNSWGGGSGSPEPTVGFAAPQWFTAAASIIVNGRAKTGFTRLVPTPTTTNDAGSSSGMQGVRCNSNGATNISYC